MNILSIESSCDETAAAVIKDGHDILSSVVVSQIDIFKAYGGVIPEVAARSHLEAILPVIHQALDQAFPNLSTLSSVKAPHPTTKSTDYTPHWSHIDAIAVTHTPGLLGSLLIGTLTARTLAILHHKPFYPVHHLKSHIYACWLDQTDAVRESNLPSFPLLALVISGGHTQIIHMPSHNSFEIIGTTRDDAVGECFDKVAKILGLPYPGGPNITSASNGEIHHQDGTTTKTTPGDPHKYHFPHPHLTSPDRNHTGGSTPSLDFSFSGLKTAVLRAVQSELDVPISFPSHDLPQKILELDDPARFIADFSASFEQTAVDILLEKLTLAQKLHPDTKSIVIAGGVSANARLRKEAGHLFLDAPCFFPQTSFTGDNAAMVGAAAFYEIQSGVQPTDPYHLDILPRSAIQ